MNIKNLQTDLRRVAAELLQLAEQTANETAIELDAAPGAKTHVLIDCENVQPNDAEVLALVPDASDLWLFHGPNQKNVAAHHAAFGERAVPVRIARTGKNALDFHLSFYMGYIASRHPDARFVVISNDKGYGPMLDHAKELGFAAEQVGFARTKTKAPARRATAKKAAAPKAAAPKAATGSAPRAAPRSAASVSAKAATKAAAKPASKPVATKKAVARKAPAAKTGVKKVAAKKVPATKAAARRTPAQAPTPIPAAAAPTATPVPHGRKSFDQVLAMLEKRSPTSRPRKHARLLADIAQMIGTDADAPEARAMLDRLVASGRISVDDKWTVSYAL